MGKIGRQSNLIPRLGNSKHKGCKTTTVLHAAFTCTNVGRSWCGSGGCDSYVIVDGVSYTAWGWKPVSVQVGDSYVVLVQRSGGACHICIVILTSN